MPYLDRVKQKESQKQFYNENKDAYRNRNQERRQRRKKWLSDFFDTQKCFICPESDNACMDLHHIDPTKKDDEVCKMLNEFRSMPRVIAEIEKCVCLCANCHRKFHNGALQFEFTDEHKIRVSQHLICETL